MHRDLAFFLKVDQGMVIDSDFPELPAPQFRAVLGDYYKNEILESG